MEGNLVRNMLQVMSVRGCFIDISFKAELAVTTVTSNEFLYHCE